MALAQQNNNNTTTQAGMNSALGQTAIGGVGGQSMTVGPGGLGPGGVKMDSNDKWFNNPQYRVTVTKPTRMFISLMQPDERVSDKSYIPCNFLVVKSKVRANFKIYTFNYM